MRTLTLSLTHSSRHTLIITRMRYSSHMSHIAMVNAEKNVRNQNISQKRKRNEPKSLLQSLSCLSMSLNLLLTMTVQISQDTICPRLTQTIAASLVSLLPQSHRAPHPSRPIRFLRSRPIQFLLPWAQKALSASQASVLKRAPAFLQIARRETISSANTKMYTTTIIFLSLNTLSTTLSFHLNHLSLKMTMISKNKIVYQ